MESDVRSLSFTSSSATVTPRSRLQAIYYVHAASADLTFSNGSGGGTTLLELTAPSAIGTETVYVPGRGLLFGNGIHVTSSSTTNIPSVTLFYEG